MFDVLFVFINGVCVCVGLLSSPVMMSSLLSPPSSSLSSFLSIIQRVPPTVRANCDRLRQTTPRTSKKVVVRKKSKLLLLKIEKSEIKMTTKKKREFCVRLYFPTLRALFPIYTALGKDLRGGKPNRWIDHREGGGGRRQLVGRSGAVGVLSTRTVLRTRPVCTSNLSRL